jgi:hypothetical protein
VQQPEEAAAEAEAERRRRLGLVLQRRVVELQLLQRVAQQLVLLRVRRIDARRTRTSAPPDSPGSASAALLVASKTVSPARVSFTSARSPPRTPTSPGPSSSAFTCRSWL